LRRRLVERDVVDVYYSWKVQNYTTAGFDIQLKFSDPLKVTETNSLSRIKLLMLKPDFFKAVSDDGIALRFKSNFEFNSAAIPP
jgi:hypothetical protein